MKGFLFFAGSLVRWSVNKPRQFLLLHGYILLVYALGSLIDLSIGKGSGLILSMGAIAPMALAIYRGLPLDCLNFESVINREKENLSSEKKTLS